MGIKSANEYSDFIITKLEAFLHDPITKVIDVYRHEERAKEIIKSILKVILGDFKGEVDLSKIREFDVLASAIDRQVTKYLHKVRGEVIGPRNKNVFYNIFYPEKVVERELLIEKYAKYLEDELLKKELAGIIKEVVNNISVECDGYDKLLLEQLIAYHLLYFLLELLWIKNGGEVFPADSRVPHHTIFDHIAATAMSVNLLYEQPGYLASLDLGGVQKYLSLSRKARDTWISSNIASMTLWLAIKPLVFVFGPDIIITPTMRFNPLYAKQLDIWINQLTRGSKNGDTVKNLTEALNLEEGTVGEKPYAIIPAKVLLALPNLRILEHGLKLAIECSEIIGLPTELKSKIEEALETIGSDSLKEEEKVEEILEKLVEGAWESIYLSVYDKENIPDSREWEKKIIEAIRNNNTPDFIKRYFEAFKNTPPFVVRTSAVRYDLNAIPESPLDKKLISFEYYLTLLYTQEGIKYRSRREPFTHIKLITEYTEALFKSTRYNQSGPQPSYIKIASDFEGPRLDYDPRGWVYCTSCGSLPAIVVSDNDVDSFISSGEKLCPICLHKRITAFSPQILFKTVFGSENHGPGNPYPYFYSTSDIANISFWDLYYSFRGIERQEIQRREMKRSIEDLTREQRRNLGDIIKKEMKVHIPELYLNGDFLVYYGILMADGDRIGKLIQGRLYEAYTLPKPIGNNHDEKLDMKIKFYTSYLKQIFNVEDPMPDQVLDRIEAKLTSERERLCTLDMEGFQTLIMELIVNLYNQYGGNEEYISKLKTMAASLLFFFYKPQITEGHNIFFKLDPRVPPSPAYQVSISRSQMITILKDIIAVEKAKGVVIYAGGDDVTAFIPLVKIEDGRLKENFLDLLKDVRWFYSFGNEEGFYRIRNYYIPMLYGLGRSMVLQLTHYRYPMSEAMRLAHEALDKLAKDGSKWEIDGCIAERDGFVVTCYPRETKELYGSSIEPLLPNLLYGDNGTCLINGLSQFEIENIVDKVVGPVFNSIHGEEKVSKSWIEDMFREMPLIEGADGEVLDRILEYILERNTWSRDGDSVEGFKEALNKLKSIARYYEQAEENYKKPYPSLALIMKNLSRYEREGGGE